MLFLVSFLLSFLMFERFSRLGWKFTVDLGSLYVLGLFSMRRMAKSSFLMGFEFETSRCGISDCSFGGLLPSIVC